MLIRCRECSKTWNDKKEDDVRMEGTCKRCVANGKEDKGLQVLFTFAEIYARDPAFKKMIDEEGVGNFFELGFN